MNSTNMFEMKVRFFQVLMFVLLLYPSIAKGNGYIDAWIQEDTIKISRDSLLRIIHLKDSMLLQSSLDSLATHNLLELVWWEKDSLQEELLNMKYTEHLDSLYMKRRDSLWADSNRGNRWALRDSLFTIEEDSVRSDMSNLLDVVYNDSARSPDPEKLRELWDKLIFHLGNDSTYFWIHYAEDDSVGVVLKNGQEVRNAIFLTNQQADSAKVYLHGKGKHVLHMWVDENLFLTHVLRRTANPKEISVDYKDVSIIKIPKRKLPKAPPQYWTRSGKVVFQLDQWAYSNWAKPGDNRLTFLLDSKGRASYKKGKLSWTNDYWYRFGIIKSEGRKLYKHVDDIRITSNLSHVALKKLNYSVNGLFISQLYPGYRSPGDSVPISRLMSPATLNLGGGMTYVVNKSLSINLQPVSGQFTFVLDTLTEAHTKYRLDPGRRVKNEFGATMYVTFKKLLWKNINMDSKLKLFSNYLKNPQNIDIDLTTQFTLKVNKYVSTSLYIHILYDDDIIIPFYEWIDGVKTKTGEGKRVQVQEHFGITFTYHL